MYTAAEAGTVQGSDIVPCPEALPARILRAEQAWTGALVRLMTVAPRGPHVKVLAPERDTLLARLSGEVAACPAGEALAIRRPALGPSCLLSITFEEAGVVGPPSADLQDAPLARLLGRMAQALDEDVALDRDGWLEEVLDRLGRLPMRRHGSRGRLRGGLAPYLLRRVLAFMEARLAEPPSLAEMAAETRLSTAHFCTAFRHATGQPPRRAFREMQLTRAAALLSDTESDLTGIAMACGFSSPSHFATAFRASAGMTPGTYRRTLRLLTADTGPGVAPLRPDLPPLPRHAVQRRDGT